MGPRPASAGKSRANSRQFAARRCPAHTPSSLANTPACLRDPPPAPAPPVPSGFPPSLLSHVIPDLPTATRFESPRPSSSARFRVSAPASTRSGRLRFVLILYSFFAFVDAVSSASNLFRFFPLPRFRRPEHSLNHRHIRNRIFQRHRNFAPLTNRPRKRVPLHGILVASRNYFRHCSAAQGVSPVINKNFARPVVRRIEGNLDLDPSLRPKKLHALVPHQLRAACKHRLSRRKLQYRRGQPVRTEFRIPLGDSRHSQWLFSENPARRRNRVAPDIHQPAAAPLRHVAHIFRIAVEVAECSHDRSQFPDHAPANELTRPQPLRMRFHHECFAYLYATPVPRGQERFRLRDR